MQRNNGKIHLVGSVPGDSAQEVFELCAGNAGSLLASLPDGETGYRRAISISWLIKFTWNTRMWKRSAGPSHRSP